MKNFFFAPIAVLAIFCGAICFSPSAYAHEDEQGGNAVEKLSASSFLKLLKENPQFNGTLSIEDKSFDLRELEVPEELQKYWNGMRITSLEVAVDRRNGAYVFCFYLAPLAGMEEKMPKKANSVHYLYHAENQPENGNFKKFKVGGVYSFLVEKDGKWDEVYSGLKDRCTLNDPCDMSPCLHDKDHCEHQQQ